jgi:hypothetical protein
MSRPLFVLLSSCAFASLALASLAPVGVQQGGQSDKPRPAGEAPSGRSSPAEGVPAPRTKEEQKPGATKPPPSSEQVKAAVTAIETALRGVDSAKKVEAIQVHSAVVDAQVIAAVAKGLREKETEVKLAAIEALRFTAHPDARKALEHWMRAERTLKDAPQVYAAALKGLGQHGSKDSISLLVEDLWGAQDLSVIQARILGLGRIRDRAAVEQLIDLIKSAGPRKTDPFMDEFRLALMVLTGVDQGKSQELWQRWWQDHKDKFQLPKTEPELPKIDAYRWKSYWGEQMGAARGERRGERGGEERRGERKPQGSEPKVDGGERAGGGA